MKSFQNQSILSAAIRGKRANIVKRIVGAFEYRVEEETLMTKLSKQMFNKDLFDNNSLHYTYMNDAPEIR